MGVADALTQGAWAYFLTIVVALCAAALIRGIVFVLAHMSARQSRQALPEPVQVAVAAHPEVESENQRLVAAIAAAVHATIGAHRLVYIGELKGTTTWASAGRAMHQTSHTLPKR